MAREEPCPACPAWWGPAIEGTGYFCERPGNCPDLPEPADRRGTGAVWCVEPADAPSGGGPRP